MNSEAPVTGADAAIRLFEAGRYEEAGAACRVALEQSQSDGQALHLCGLVELKLGRPASAVAFLARAVQLRPADPIVHTNFGEALRAAGEWGQAEHHLRYALHLDRTLKAAHYNLGFVLREKGDMEGAETSFRNALVIDATFAAARSALGQLLVQEDRPAEAAEVLAQVLESDPNNPETTLALGQSLWGLGRTREALSAYTAAAGICPENGAIRFYRARARFELCEDTGAIDDLEVAVRHGCLSDAVSSPRVVAGRLARMEGWCDQTDLAKVARAQWHRVAERPRVFAQDGAEHVPGSLQPYTGDITVGRVGGALVLPRELLVLTRAGELIIDGVVSRPRDRPHTSRYIAHFADDGRLLLVLPSRTLDLEGEAVLLGGANHLFDWTFECLARLWILRQRPALEKLPLVVQSGLSGRQEEMLSLLGYGQGRVVRVPEDAGLQCETLHVPSLVSVGDFVAPAAVEHLRREFQCAIPQAFDSPRRVYLSDRSPGGGRLLNEGELRSTLSDRGFTIVQAETLSVTELLVLVRSAEVIVGPESDSMTFVFSAPRNAKVGMVVAQGLYDTRFFGPSAALGHEVSYLLASPDFGSNASLRRCDFTLSPELLERYLDAIRV